MWKKWKEEASQVDRLVYTKVLGENKTWIIQKKMNKLNMWVLRVRDEVGRCWKVRIWVFSLVTMEVIQGFWVRCWWDKVYIFKRLLGWPWKYQITENKEWMSGRSFRRQLFYSKQQLLIALTKVTTLRRIRFSQQWCLDFWLLNLYGWWWHFLW